MGPLDALILRWRQRADQLPGADEYRKALLDCADELDQLLANEEAQP